MGIKTSTTEALRKFYERDGYALLKDEKTFEELIVLAHFGKTFRTRTVIDSLKNTEEAFCFKLRTKQHVDIFCVCIFLHNKDSQNLLDEDFSMFFE